MIIVLATRNREKIREIEAFLDGGAWTVRTCQDYPGCPVPAETGAAFEENARLKALTVARYTGEVALADDSGLEVDALGGAPGVYSARFAGEVATDAENNARLLTLMAGVPEPRRTARFRCVIAIANPDGTAYTFPGVCEGVIALAPRGDHGFGYDPLFVPDGRTETFGALEPDYKRRISHRARAFAAASGFLQSLKGVGSFKFQVPS